jgi:hypothetical protein
MRPVKVGIAMVILAEGTNSRRCPIQVEQQEIKKPIRDKGFVFLRKTSIQ